MKRMKLSQAKSALWIRVRTAADSGKACGIKYGMADSQLADNQMSVAKGDNSSTPDTTN